MYDEAKRFAESLTTAFRATHGVDTVIVRLFNTFGPRLRTDDGRAVPTFIRQALAGEPITVSGDGSQTRSLCYVDDAVEGLLRLVRWGHPGPMNPGNPREVSVLALALMVRDLPGSDSGITFVPRPVDDPCVRRPHIALAARELGWHPVVPLEEALLHTITWYRDRREGASPTGPPGPARRFVHLPHLCCELSLDAGPFLRSQPRPLVGQRPVQGALHQRRALDPAHQVTAVPLPQGVRPPADHAGHRDRPRPTGREHRLLRRRVEDQAIDAEPRATASMNARGSAPRSSKTAT